MAQVNCYVMLVVGITNAPHYLPRFTVGPGISGSRTASPAPMVSIHGIGLIIISRGSFWTRHLILRIEWQIRSILVPTTIVSAC